MTMSELNYKALLDLATTEAAKEAAFMYPPDYVDERREFLVLRTMSNYIDRISPIPGKQVIGYALSKYK